MNLQNNKVSLIRLDIDYVKKLHDTHSEVFFTTNPNYKNKPYFGVLITINNMKYAIPFTTAKEKHLSWRNNSAEYIKVTEDVKYIKPFPKFMYTKSNDPTISKPYKILYSILDLRKAVPIKEGVYTLIDIDNETEYSKILLRKEYDFCEKNKEVITKKMTRLYEKYLKKGSTIYKQCDYSLLEKICVEYEVDLEKEKSIASDREVLTEVALEEK